MKSKTGLYSYSDALDKLLMLFGTLGSIGDGSMTPLTMFILNGLINDFSGAGFDIPNEVVNKVCKVFNGRLISFS